MYETFKFKLKVGVTFRRGEGKGMGRDPSKMSGHIIFLISTPVYMRIFAFFIVILCFSLFLSYVSKYSK